MMNKGILTKYKYLLFDADDTLLDFKAAEETALKNVLKNNHLPYDDETVKTYSKINLKYWKAFEKGEIERDQIFPLRFGEFLGVLDVQPIESFTKTTDLSLAISLVKEYNSKIIDKIKVI